MKELLFKSIGHIDSIEGDNIYVTLFENKDLDNPKHLLIDHSYFKPEDTFDEEYWFYWNQYSEDDKVFTEIEILEPDFYTKEELEEEYKKLMKELPDGI